MALTKKFESILYLSYIVILFEERGHGNSESH
jgi:hypothetical protein